MTYQKESTGLTQEKKQTVAVTRSHLYDRAHPSSTPSTYALLPAQS